jgi:hypothetical protein
MIWAIPAGLLGLLLVVLVAGGWYFSNLVMFIEKFTPAEVYNFVVEDGLVTSDGFLAWPQQEVWIDSPHGYRLFGLYLPLEGVQRTVILAHGVTVNAYLSLRYAAHFRALGFNVLLYTHRNHGRSGGRTTTYGYYEKDDLRACVDWVQARNGDDVVIGTHGESMGAATVLQHAALDRRLRFVIADCPFANAHTEFAYRLKAEYGLPAFPLIPVASAITKLRDGWFFHEAAPLADVDKITAPLLLIHGQADDYIPPEASRKLYAAANDPKRLYLMPDADHAESYRQRETYRRVLRDFLREKVELEV